MAIASIIGNSSNQKTALVSTMVIMIDIIEINVAPSSTHSIQMSIFDLYVVIIVLFVVNANIEKIVYVTKKSQPL